MKHLAQLRRAAYLTQHSLSKLAKVSRARIADVETGRGKFTDAEHRRVFTVLVRRIEENLRALNAADLGAGDGAGDVAAMLRS